jgi:hypothetical protein
MPEHYEPTHQVVINAIYNVYLPRYRNAGLILLVLLAGGVAWKWRRRR